MVTKRARLWLTRGVTIAAVITVVGLFIATWLQAGTIESRWLAVSHRTPAGSGVVVSVDGDQVVLRDDGGADVPGVWGLVFEGGRAVVGDVQATGLGGVRRTIREVTGALTPGTEVEFDVAVWGPDELERFGLTEDLADGPEGPLPVWTAPGTDDTWVVIVHGNGADRAQALRLVPAISEAGYPVAIATLRNDDGTTPSSDGRHGFGYDEWQDLDAVLAFGMGRGALDFVLVGFGSGGSVVGVHLYESRLESRVVGIVLDSPMLRLGSAIDGAWLERGVPSWAIGWTKAIAAMRFGLDLGVIDHVERSSQWNAPILILHGRDDDVYPLDSVEAFAITHGADALLLTFPGAGPGASWNSDPDRYEAAVAGFLDEVAAPPSLFEMIDPNL